jgi:hypothetical protein
VVPTALAAATQRSCRGSVSGTEATDRSGFMR